MLRGELQGVSKNLPLLPARFVPIRRIVRGPLAPERLDSKLPYQRQRAFICIHDERAHLPRRFLPCLPRALLRYLPLVFPLLLARALALLLRTGAMRAPG
jgi:hypothetical protein